MLAASAPSKEWEHGDFSGGDVNSRVVLPHPTGARSLGTPRGNMPGPFQRERLGRLAEILLKKSNAV